MRASIRRDGFVAPILLRPRGARYEVVSGNHRALAARAEGLRVVPAVIAELDDVAAMRLAVAMNLVHGDPPVETLAPFIAELPTVELAALYIPDDLLARLVDFDETLRATLAELDAPAGFKRCSSTTSTNTCKCATCGRVHVVGAG